MSLAGKRVAAYLAGMKAAIFMNRVFAKKQLSAQ
jgi:hypothetical protein